MIRQLLYLVTILSLLAGVISCEKTVPGKQKQKTHIDSLIVLGQDRSLSDEKRIAYTDTVYIEAAKKKNDSLTRYYYRQAAVNYYNLYMHDKSISVSNSLYDLSLSAKDSVGMSKGLQFLAALYYEKSDIDKAYDYYTRAEKVQSAFSKKDNRTLGEIILYKAYIYYDVGEYVLCENEAFRAHTLLLPENKPSDLYNCYNLIATALEGQNNNKEAIRYFGFTLEVLDRYKEEGVSDADIDILKASCYNNMGGAYVKMGLPEKAIDLYQQALSFPKIKESQRLYAKLLNNLASAKFKSGNDSGVSVLLSKSQKIRDSLEDEMGSIASELTLGEYNLHKKDTLKSIAYLKTAYAKAKEAKSNNDVLASLKILYEIDAKHTNKYMNRYLAVKDSLQQISENSRNKFARIQYDTDRIITEKEALAKKNSFIIGVSIVVVLFIAAIFIIYYLNSRNKELLLMQEQQKANEEIYELMFEQQGKIESAKTEEKSRIAMELHDGILNNIYAVRLNLEFINKKADDESIARRKEYIKELQNVESEIRGVSHDLSRNALFNQEQSFENMLEFMITSQKNTFDTEFEAEIDPEIEWENMTNVCKVNVYRIIQEALQNINKYSHASTATVTIDKIEGKVSITVADNGKGFEPEKAKGGIGLKNLKKRADALNGTLQINSQEGKGAEIRVLFEA